MKRRTLLTRLGVVTALQLGLAAAAFAASAADQIVAQLRGQGFAKIEVEQTWLGRTRILAERGNASREIILNPNTGEILRDLWLTKSGKDTSNVQIGGGNGTISSGSGGTSGSSGNGGSGGSGGSGGGDDDDSDNSGSGSGSDNSGSGNRGDD